MDLLRDELDVSMLMFCRSCNEMEQFPELWDDPNVISASKMIDVSKYEDPDEDLALFLAWCDIGSVKAYEAGWRINRDGKFYCPDCAKTKLPSLQ